MKWLVAEGAAIAALAVATAEDATQRAPTPWVQWLALAILAVAFIRRISATN